MTGSLTDKVAVITGGGGAIGGAVADLLGVRGAKVALLDRAGAGAAVAETLGVKGVDALGVEADVRDRAGVQRALDAVVDRFGPIDILVNNAAATAMAPFLEVTDEDWSRLLAINLTGYFIVAQEAIRRMTRLEGARVINVSSAAFLIANSDQASYAVTKAGITALTRALAFEFGRKGLTANTVPGATSVLTDDARVAREQRIPAGRLARAEEIAEVIAFLASPAASYVNGQVILVDGGLTIAGVRSGEA